MKTKAIILIVVSLIPLTAFSQPQPPTPPNPPNPPNAPQPPRDREDRRPKVPVTFLGVDTSEVPSVLCDQLGLPKGFGLVVDYVVPDNTHWSRSGQVTPVPSTACYLTPPDRIFASGFQ